MPGLGILIPPASSGSSWLPYPRNQVSRNYYCLQPFQAAALASAKGICERLVNGNKPDSLCQRQPVLPVGYQGRGDACGPMYTSLPHGRPTTTEGCLGRITAIQTLGLRIRYPFRCEPNVLRIAVREIPVIPGISGRIIVIPCHSVRNRSFRAFDTKLAAIPRSSRVSETTAPFSVCPLAMSCLSLRTSHWRMFISAENGIHQKSWGAVV